VQVGNPLGVDGRVVQARRKQRVEETPRCGGLDGGFGR
jgi:hypothetical protein